MLESSHHFYAAKNEFAEHGIEATVKLQLDQLLKRKDDVVNRLTGGVEGLFKKNKITHLQGSGKVTAPGEIEVTGKDGTQKIKGKKITNQK